MVHPDHRREGIFSRLLDAAVPELDARGRPVVLLIVDRNCDSGAAFVRDRGAQLLRSEYRMEQSSPPVLRPEFDRVELREATDADTSFLRDCLTRAFGREETDEDVAERLPHTLLISYDGDPAGSMLVDKAPPRCGIYGFAVVPELQGRGIGRAALSKVTNSVRGEGFEAVHLEVAVDNPAALHLYEDCGFELLGAEDYYQLAW
jgi:ribosomal protein S18 acetylase RimI-like enzyme